MSAPWMKPLLLCVCVFIVLGAVIVVPMVRSAGVAQLGLVGRFDGDNGGGYGHYGAFASKTRRLLRHHRLARVA